MRIRGLLLMVCAAAPALAGEWNARAAAGYLDGRAQQWAEWPRSNQAGVTCVACHTSFPYLLARPALRRTLGETRATGWEAKLLEGVRGRAGRMDVTAFSPDAKPGHHSDQLLGSQAVLAAFLLARDDASRGAALSAETEQAFDRMWRLQVASGPDAGAWAWTAVDLDPWETVESAFYGAALAAAATGTAPGRYAARPAIQPNVERLRAYLRRAQASQPLHNRLLLLWASGALGGLLSDAERSALREAAWQRQSSDGGWTLEALGAWKPHAAAPPSTGSNAYATALAAYVLAQAGTPGADPRMERARAWLRSHQSADGYWDAFSMNKRYAAGSMPEQFMRDAATAYASLALIEGGREEGSR